MKPVFLGVKRLLKITFPFHLLSLHQLVRWATNAPWSIFFRFSALRMKYMSSRGGEKGLSFRDVLFSGYAKVNAQHGIYFMYRVSLIRVHLIIIRHGNPDIFQVKTFEILLQNYFASFVYLFHAFTSKKEKKRYRKLIKPTCPKICDHNYHSTMLTL